MGEMMALNQVEDAMTTAAEKCELQFSLHGVELHYQTSSSAFMAPVLAFLRHFRTDIVS